MTQRSAKDRQGGRKLIMVGFSVIVILFVMYSRYQNSELLTPDAIGPIQRIAYGFYIGLLAALGAISYGIYIYHREKVKGGKRDLLSIIAISTWNRQSRRVFIVVFVVYGMFFSLASGTLVYQPEINFAEQYDAPIPSGFVAPCCDSPGYMPKAIVYLTEHVGLQIIPINLVLQIIVSYLVGLNTSIAISAYAYSKSEGGLGTIGAAAGLFVACPTCAGTFFSVFIGTASGIALTVALTQLQTLFIAVSIPILLVTPFVMAKKLRNADGSCKIDPRQ